MSKKICYIDCFSGIAGDMLLSALIDAGASIESIKHHLKTIDDIKDEWDITISSVVRSKGRISAKHLNVKSIYNHEPIILTSEFASVSHDHKHSHSHECLDDLNDDSVLNHEHSHSHSHSHFVDVGDHDHSNDEHQHDHSHSHNRGLFEISKMINNSQLSPFVKSQSIKAFTELAKSEAKVHNTSIDKVHFHEVGAIDSIIDTVGVLIALELLKVDEIYCSALPLSTGTVWTAHGLLPVPAPATLYLMKDMVLVPGPKGVTGELVTPTGATLIRTICNMPNLNFDLEELSTKPSHNQGVPPIEGFTLSSIGVGAGSKDFPNHPNILRVMIGSKHSSVNDLRLSSQIHLNCDFDYHKDNLILLETNLDDITSELIGYILDKIISYGVNDCWIENIYMKKNRPAFKLSVLCSYNQFNDITTILFRETTGIGLRVTYINRIALKRDIFKISTSYGEVNVKSSLLNNKIINIKPEYEDCKSIAIENNIPLKSVMTAVNSSIELFKTVNPDLF